MAVALEVADVAEVEPGSLRKLPLGEFAFLAPPPDHGAQLENRRWILPLRHRLHPAQVAAVQRRPRRQDKVVEEVQ